MTTTTASASWRALAVLPPGAFRLLLALAVVISHISKFDIGRLAVLLFFFLSGYWVTRIWEEKFGPGSTLRFYAARYLRIAPLYLIAAGVAAVGLGSAYGPETFTLLGVASSDRDPLGISWSLDIELQFYLLLPLLALRWPWVAVLSVPAAAAAWVLSERFGVVTVVQYLPAFALGALTHARQWRPSETTAAASLGLFGLVTVATYLFTPFADKTLPDPFHRDIYALFWMLPLLPYVARSLHVRSGRLDRHAGNLSYPLYLVHYPIIAGLTGWLGGGGGVRLGAAALAILVALAFYMFVDRPIDAWRVRLTEGQRA